MSTRRDPTTKVDNGRKNKQKKKSANPRDFLSHCTGVRRSIAWDTGADPIPVHAEAALLRSAVLLRRGEYGIIRDGDDREQEITRVAHRWGMTTQQAMAVRQQLLVQNFSFHGNRDVQKKIRMIKKAIENKTPIMKLTHELDQPPMSIFRVFLLDRVRNSGKKKSPKGQENVFKARVRDIVQGKNTKLLNDWEKEQLEIAKENDAIAYEPPIRREKADDWESQVYEFLNKLNIKYLSEKDFLQAGCPITPDCLILDDLYINGKLVRWIEVKSFYLSGSKDCNKLFASKLKKQVQKYEDGFGEPGAVLFKHGFSEIVADLLPTTLCLDSSVLAEPEERR